MATAWIDLTYLEAMQSPEWWDIVESYPTVRIRLRHADNCKAKNG